MPAACRLPPWFKFPLNKVLTRSPDPLNIMPHPLDFLRPLLIAMRLDLTRRPGHDYLKLESR